MADGATSGRHVPPTGNQAHVRCGRIARAGSGSARSRLPDGGSLSLPSTELLIKRWNAEKENSIRTILTHVADKYFCTSSWAFALL